MIRTNAHPAHGIAVVRGTSLRESLAGLLGLSASSISADGPAGVAGSAQELDKVNSPELRPCDPATTPARWVRLV
jgi:hypothetical protein